MKRTPILPKPEDFPEVYHPLLTGHPVFDSSCSADARVFYIAGEGGLYLKTAAPGTLKQEADLDAYFHSFGLGPEVLDYQTCEKDWLLTRAVRGEDCTHAQYLSDPRRLAETMARMLLELHSRKAHSCPVPDHTDRYLAKAAENHAAGRYDAALFPDNWGYPSADEAWAVVEANGKYLKSDTLLHGDFCLPNILLDNWKPSGFIDLGGAGLGDRHVDLFWGKWTLNFNLKTDKYCDYFLDAYGREKIEEELLRTVAALEGFL